MRHLGIDYGKKHIGISLSDMNGEMAFPHDSINNSKTLVNDIEKICIEKEVKIIVVGESKNFQGEENEIMVAAREFVEDITLRVGLPIHFEPEFMTSVEARHIQGGGEKTHSSAATLILQSYLDKKKNGTYQ